MGWLAELEGEIVGLDTAPLIFFIERHHDYIDAIRPFFQAADDGQIQIVTSTVTLLEVLIQPIRRRDEHLAYRYNDILLSSPNITTAVLTPNIAQQAAELRAEYALKTVDSIQIATALEHDAKSFLTNDRDFSRVSAIEIIYLRDLIK